MARKIVITSGKGGVGKTTICANIGYMLASKGLKVLLIDFDIGLNNLDVVMGIENKVVYDLIDVASGKCRPQQAIVQDCVVNNLYILPSNSSYGNCNIVEESFNQIIEELEEYFDYIIIDSPAGMESGFFRAINYSDDSIIVTTPHISAIRDANKIINILRSCNMNVTGVVVNRVRGDLIIANEMLSVLDISKYLNIDILGTIPEDDAIAKQLLSGERIKKQSEIYCAFKYLVDRIHDGDNKIYDCTKKYRGVFGSIRRSLRRWV